MSYNRIDACEMILWFYTQYCQVRLFAQNVSCKFSNLRMFSKYVKYSFLFQRPHTKFWFFFQETCTRPLPMLSGYSAMLSGYSAMNKTIWTRTLQSTSLCYFCGIQSVYLALACDYSFVDLTYIISKTNPLQLYNINICPAFI